jgi:thiamine kinase-like enzyme
MGTIGNRAVFNIQMNHVKEIIFNSWFVAADKEVASPQVYCARVSYLTGNFCLITEHMTDYIEHKENFTEEDLELVLKNLAALHARYWHDSSMRTLAILPIFTVWVDMLDAMVASSWSAAARKILVKSWILTNKSETILHGDARIGNMLFPSGEGKGRFVFIDWQAVRKGKAAYDVAYFIVLNLLEDFRRENETKAVKLYYRYLVAAGVKDYPFEKFEEDYRHACLCVLVLLSLPLLSGEASVQGQAAVNFVYGMDLWRKRLTDKFNEFDYQWLAKNYHLTEQEGREAIAEMLGVIEKRVTEIYQKNKNAPQVPAA